jgi:ribosome-associated protein
MDIRKLQRAIVDGLEDVKAQHIVVFNTEHLSPLFERVIIASGSSNRQTKALASSVCESVKARGLEVLRTEGEDNGEWIIVDCGAAVAHIMQPAIRDYYRLEEIWGGKAVKMKLASVRGLPTAEDDDDGSEPAEAAAPAPRPARKARATTPGQGTALKAAAAGTARQGAASAPARKAPAKPPARKVAGKAPAKPAGEAPVREMASKAPARKAAVKAPAGKTAAKPPAGQAAAKLPARKSAGRSATPVSRTVKVGVPKPRPAAPRKRSAG